MITLFNRKELFTTFSLKEQAKVQNLLEENKIEYITKVMNQTRSSIGINSNWASQYTIYVRKSDWERASYITRV